MNGLLNLSLKLASSWLHVVMGKGGGEAFSLMSEKLVQSYKEHCFLTVGADGVWSPVPRLQPQGCSFHDIFTGTLGVRPSREP